MAGESEVGLAEDIRTVVEAIHSSSCMAVLNVTGGGSHAISWLLSVPGASATILEASVPYSVRSLRASLHGRPPPVSSASAGAAAALASAAYATAVRLAPQNCPRLVGIGAAAAIKSNRVLRGPHRAHVCVLSDYAEISYEASFSKTAGRTRLGEEVLTSRLVLQALLDASQDPLPSVSAHPMSLLRDRLTSDGDVLAQPVLRERADPVGALLGYTARSCELDGPVAVAQMEANGCWRLGSVSATALLPGSFNPLHVGHRKLLEAARSFLPADTVVGYELSVSNPDKPTLHGDVVRARAAQFIGSDTPPAPLVLTSEPLFAGKAVLLPGTTFIVGYDTAIRILNPKYYGGVGPMLDALVQIAKNGCSFLVGGRRESPMSGEFLSFDPCDAPDGFSSIFQSIPEHLFREDVSSTQLRDAAQGKDTTPTHKE